MPAWVTVLLALSVPVCGLLGVWLGAASNQRGAEKAAKQALEGQRVLADDAARREWRRRQVAPYLEVAKQRVQLRFEMHDADVKHDELRLAMLTPRERDHEYTVLAFTHLAIPDEAFKEAFKRFKDADDKFKLAKPDKELLDLVTTMGGQLVFLNIAAERYIFSLEKGGEET